jgi:hypothetical protein
MYGKDCFIETEQKNRTNALALEFINKVQYKMGRFYNVGESGVAHVKNAMRKATMEVKTVRNGAFKGLKYIDIYGEDFGGYGCDPCENPFDECVIVAE